MTDNTSLIAGNYPGANWLKLTSILNEGAPTVSTAFDQAGFSQKVLTWGTELYVGDFVAISNETDNTFAACGGAPILEKAVDSETLVVGRIVDVPVLQRFPAASADANDLSERLAGEYYRVAGVQLMGGIQQVVKATVMCDGSHATVPGVGGTLKFNMASSYVNHGLYFDSVASGGVGVIPFHYVPAGTDGDLYSCLVGITGLLPSVTGA